ncbi:MAG: metallophosphoesterase family protein [Armatimonadetes bacterium]|nr:metallophosphoesterase family protein [Armatimonadota bacterium]
MRWGIFGDAHGNLQGLEAVLSALAREGVDRYLNLGDLVGYGADPNGCCDRVRELDCISLLGNHDQAAIGGTDLEWFNESARAAAEWTMHALDADHRAWLAELQPYAAVNGFLAVHSSLPEPGAWRYVLSSDQAAETLAACQQSVVLIGHTHLAEAYRRRTQGGMAHLSLARGGKLSLTLDSRYVLNPGSCGQPRDQWWQAAFAVLDTEEMTFTVQRVAYDMSTASDRILWAGLPTWLAMRLAEGR